MNEQTDRQTDRQTDSGDWVSCFDDFDTHNRQAGDRKFWQVLFVLLTKSEFEILVSLRIFFLIYKMLGLVYESVKNATQTQKQQRKNPRKVLKY